MDLLHRNLYFSKNPERVQDFPGGGRGNFFQGVQMLISIETHITCDFPGRGFGSNISPLYPHIAMLGVIDICTYAMSTD